MRVGDNRRGRLPHDLQVSGRQQRPAFNAIDVYGLEPIAPMALDAAAVGFHQHIGANLGIAARHAVRFEYVDHEQGNQIPRYIRTRFH